MIKKTFIEVVQNSSNYLDDDGELIVKQQKERDKANKLEMIKQQKETIEREKEELKKMQEKTNIRESEISLGYMSGILTVGAFVGYLFKKALDELTEGSIKCSEVEDDHLKDLCLMGVLDKIILDLTSKKSGCIDTKDPIKCEKELIKRIDKLIKRKLKIQKKLDSYDFDKELDI